MNLLEGKSHPAGEPWRCESASSRCPPGLGPVYSQRRAQIEAFMAPSIVGTPLQPPKPRKKLRCAVDYSVGEAECDIPQRRGTSRRDVHVNMLWSFQGCSGMMSDLTCCSTLAQQLLKVAFRLVTPCCMTTVRRPCAACCAWASVRCLVVL